MSTEQVVENGNNNLQAGRDAKVINNYFSEYRPVGIRFYEDDICMVLNAFNEYCDNVEDLKQDMDIDEFEMVGKPEKNRLNNLSEEYFQTICDEYLPYFKKVESFLKAPQNKLFLKNYRKTADQIKFRIGVLRKYYEYFEDVLNVILNEIIADKESVVVKDIDVFIIFINYMYWNCDIGRRK